MSDKTFSLKKKSKNKKNGWRCSTFPQSTCSILDAKALNFRVRYGIGCDILAIITSQKAENEIMLYIIRFVRETNK